MVLRVEIQEFTVKKAKLLIGSSCHGIVFGDEIYVSFSAVMNYFCLKNITFMMHQGVIDIATRCVVISHARTDVGSLKSPLPRHLQNSYSCHQLYCRFHFFSWLLAYIYMLHWTKHHGVIIKLDSVPASSLVMNNLWVVLFTWHFLSLILLSSQHG